MRRLPPLKSLRVFEAAARHSSISAAATELNVTHSAVSQQIKLLENYFGQKLFVRSARGIALTSQAQAYLSDVRASFDRIEAASQQLVQVRRGRLLRINTTPSLAVRWLIPKASSFRPAHPSIELQITTSVSDEIAHLSEPYDFILRRNKMHQVDYECCRFLDDTSTALASPEFLMKYSVRRPRDLRKIPLLHLKSRPDAWVRWFKENGVETSETVKGSHFDHFFLSLQAAINGFGAAMGPFCLVQDDLSAGRLVAPFPEKTLIGPGFHVLFKQGIARDRAASMFLDWLLQASH